MFVIAGVRATNYVLNDIVLVSVVLITSFEVGILMERLLLSDLVAESSGLHSVLFSLNTS